ncbi:DUF4292 domain-containing protein [soil metagenome]|jgi:hypothetical protein
MNNRLCFLFLVCTSLFFSCRRGTVPVATAPAEPETLNNVTVHNLDFTYFTSRGRVQYESTDSRQSSAMTIRMKKDSVIWISLVPVLGIEAVRAKITRDSIMIVDRIHRTYYAGNFDILKERFNIDLSFDILQNILVGNYTSAGPGRNERLLEETPLQHTQQRRGSLVIDQFIDASSYKLVRVEAQDETSNNRLTAHYSEFAPLGAWPFANAVLIAVQGRSGSTPSSTTVSINHRQSSITETDLTFPFSVPSGYEAR